MARVKGTRDIVKLHPEGTRLPRAKFQTMKLHPAQVQCRVCGLVVRKGNMARHKRDKHTERHKPIQSCSSSSETSDSDGVAGETSPKSVFDSPRCRGLVSPMEKPIATVTPERVRRPPEVPRTDNNQRPRLVVRLPNVARALDKVTNTHSSPGLGVRHLPPTPQSDEDLHRELARLYSKKVRVTPPDTAISYGDTSVILSVAKDLRKRESFKQILEGVNLALMTKEEYKTLTKPAVVPATPEPPMMREPHPLVVSTTHQEGEPQVVSVHMGGSWGIKLTHYKVSDN